MAVPMRGLLYRLKEKLAEFSTLSEIEGYNSQEGLCAFSEIRVIDGY
ncbi:MAG: hypothetical protein QXH00_10200 [Candidatus Jordarchaeales archaeon]